MLDRWKKPLRTSSGVAACVAVVVVGALLLIGWASSATAALQAPDVEAMASPRVMFPVIAKRWPPLPYPGVLNPIDNADGDWFYSVSWPSIDLAETYLLEEDDDAGFSSPTTVYDGAGTSWSVTETGKSPGTYYYRVRGHNEWGYGAYSNVEAVTVLHFRAEHAYLTVGQCTTLSWDFTGIKALYISFGYGYERGGVVGQGAYKVCPSVTTTYEALVIKQDEGQEIHYVTINVSGSGCADPVVWHFAPTTYFVNAGEPFSISWDVECAKAVWLIKGGGSEQPVEGQGSVIDVTIHGSKTFRLKIEKTGGGFVYASFTVHLT